MSRFQVRRSVLLGLALLGMMFAVTSSAEARRYRGVVYRAPVAVVRAPVVRAPVAVVRAPAVSVRVAPAYYAPRYVAPSYYAPSVHVAVPRVGVYVGY